MKIGLVPPRWYTRWLMRQREERLAHLKEWIREYARSSLTLRLLMEGQMEANENGKKWYQSKTVWFNVLAFIVAVATAFGYTGELPEDWAVFVPAAVAIINLILRWLTKEPIH